MTTSPEDVAALFDLPPTSSQPDESAAETLEAAEAALAAELAISIDPDAVAGDAPDSRTNRRVDVSWPARMQAPEGPVIELLVRNVSATGVGLVSAHHIPAYTVVNFEMDVPPLEGGGEPTLVKGAIETTYTAVRGAEILCGGTWQGSPAGLELVSRWIGR